MKRALAFLAFLSASPAFAQGFEVALLGGYTTPGGLTPRALDVQELRLAGSFTWGVTAGYLFSDRYGFEASWTRVGSDLEIGDGTARLEMFDVRIDQVQGSFVLRLGGQDSRLRPFFTAGAGAAFFGAPDLDGETKLSFGLGAGLRWRPSQKVGARVQARYTPTYLNDESSDFCDPFGFCQSWLHQFEMLGGVVVRF
jgi:opacity protein-like surface antigen